MNLLSIVRKEHQNDQNKISAHNTPYSIVTSFQVMQSCSLFQSFIITLLGVADTLFVASQTRPGHCVLYLIFTMYTMTLNPIGELKVD